MSYEIGDKILSVGENLPNIAASTAAKNWANFEERMRYVFALFREFHMSPDVFARPFPESEMDCPAVLQKYF